MCQSVQSIKLKFEFGIDLYGSDLGIVKTTLEYLFQMRQFRSNSRQKLRS